MHAVLGGGGQAKQGGVLLAAGRHQPAWWQAGTRPPPACGAWLYIFVISLLTFATIGSHAAGKHESSMQQLMRQLTPSRTPSAALGLGQLAHTTGAANAFWPRAALMGSAAAAAATPSTLDASPVVPDATLAPSPLPPLQDIQPAPAARTPLSSPARASPIIAPSSPSKSPAALALKQLFEDAPVTLEASSDPKPYTGAAPDAPPADSPTSLLPPNGLLFPASPAGLDSPTGPTAASSEQSPAHSKAPSSTASPPPSLADVPVSAPAPPVTGSSASSLEAAADTPAAVSEALPVLPEDEAVEAEAPAGVGAPVEPVVEELSAVPAPASEMAPAAVIEATETEVSASESVPVGEAVAAAAAAAGESTPEESGAADVVTAASNTTPLAVEGSTPAAALPRANGATPPAPVADAAADAAAPALAAPEAALPVIVEAAALVLAKEAAAPKAVASKPAAPEAPRAAVSKPASPLARLFQHLGCFAPSPVAN